MFFKAVNGVLVKERGRAVKRGKERVWVKVYG